jgi:iron complex outermembrane recepter protein
MTRRKTVWQCALLVLQLTGPLPVVLGQAAPPVSDAPSSSAPDAGPPDAGPASQSARLQDDAPQPADAGPADGRDPIEATATPAPAAIQLSTPTARSAPAPGAALEPAGEPQSRAYTAVATATRSLEPLRDVPASVSLLTRAQIDLHPSLTTDGLLRSLPAVATFRRSSSLVADPSSQGLNLRGLAPSGVSRTLVLLDGIPVNDPFGGWVYWRALPRLGLDRIEVVHGGGSALYGSAALAGVVQLFSRSTLCDALDADVAYGSQGTFTLGARAAHRFGKLGASLEGEWLRSDGYRIVSPEQRGPIDGKTPSEHGNINGRVAYEVTPKLQLAAALGVFREVQNGGTRFTTAEVTLGNLSLEGHLDADTAGRFDLTLYGRRASFGQVRARVAEGRTMEVRASRQEVPAGDEGGSLTWTSRELRGAGRHTLLAGLDARHASGDSTDFIEPAMRMDDSVVRKKVGGEQWLLGMFAQDLYRVAPALDLQLSLRGDIYRSYAGQRTTTFGDDSQRVVDSEASSEAQLSPRLGVLVRPLEWLRVRGSLYRAFRAPTLNELYRSFQVGTILTAANDRLGPEELIGGELGVELLAQTAFNLRVTGFLNVLDRPITNVTLAEPLPDGSMRQRQNLGSARVHGIELDARWRFGQHLQIGFGYTWANSEVTDSGPMSLLVGKQLAQDPEHRATTTVWYDRPDWFSAMLQLRALGTQYEDDLNTLQMNGALIVDASLSRRVIEDLEVFLAAENLFDAEYLVGRAGIDTVGAPLSVRVGLRLRAY